MKVAAAAALLTCVLASPALAGVGESRGVLPFIEDDYPAALAQARQRQVPIFIEAWAPW